MHTLWIIRRGNAALALRLGFSHRTPCWLNPASTKVKSRTPIDFSASRFWLFRNAQPYVFSFWKYHVVAFGPCRVLVTQKEHEEFQPVLTCPRLRELRALGRFWWPKVLLLSCFGVLGGCFNSQISRKHICILGQRECKQLAFAVKNRSEGKTFELSLCVWFSNKWYQNLVLSSI